MLQEGRKLFMDRFYSGDVKDAGCVRVLAEGVDARD